jgi:hypothetical protein
LGSHPRSVKYKRARQKANSYQFLSVHQLASALFMLCVINTSVTVLYVDLNNPGCFFFYEREL